MSLFRKKEPPKIAYDPAVQEPALWSSICTALLDAMVGRSILLAISTCTQGQKTYRSIQSS